MPKDERVIWGTWELSSWLRHYATSRKVAGSIPDEVIGFFNGPNPPSRSMALWSTQPLTEMSTRNLPGGKVMPARKADNLTAICEPIVKRKCGSLDASQPYCPSWPVTGIALPFSFAGLPVVLYGYITRSLTLREERFGGVWEQGAEGNIWA
jgi:hypothetical protein